VAAAIGVEDAAGAVVTGDAVATGVGVGIGLAVGVWPGARVVFDVGRGVRPGELVGPMDATITAGPPTLTPPGAGGSVASAGAHDATARANAAAPATAAIFLRFTTDRPPAWIACCCARNHFMIARTPPSRSKDLMLPGQPTGPRKRIDEPFSRPINRTS
jgi:hypothetical protein